MINEAFSNMATNKMQQYNKVTNKVPILDAESIEAQLDRLNLAVMGILSPEDKEECDSLSFRAYNTYLDTEGETLESNDYFQKHNRLLMISEDYRSHEIRKESISGGNIKATLKDLYDLKKNVRKSIKLIESNLATQVKLSLCSIQLTLDIIDKPLFASKNQISKKFRSCESPEKNFDPYIQQLENELEDLRFSKFHNFSFNSLEKHMLESYCDNIKFINSEAEIHHVPERVSSIKKRKTFEPRYHLPDTNINTNTNEFDWECVQIKLIKNNYEQKMNSLKDREKNLGKLAKECENEIQRKIKMIDCERKKIRKEKEKLKSSEDDFKLKIRTVKREIEKYKETIEPEDFVCNTVPTPCGSPISITSRSVSPLLVVKNEPVKIDNPADIEIEIKKLESELQSSLNKSIIEFKINHLKNKISSIRSNQVLKTNFSKGRMNSFMSNKRVIKTQKSFVGSPQTKASTKTPQSDEKTARRSDSKLGNIPKIENLVKTLELKDMRLRKKEEELIRKELQINTFWEKNQNVKQFLSYVQIELNAYKGKVDNVNESQVQLDRQIKENLEAFKRLKKLESDYADSLDKITEKVKISDNFMDIIKKLDNIKY